MSYEQFARILLTVVGTVSISLLVFFSLGCGKKTDLYPSGPVKDSSFPRTYPPE